MPTLLLNLGHFLTHYVLLIYPTVALGLAVGGGGTYGDLLLPSTAGFVAFAVMTLPAAWAGDRFSRPALLRLQFLGMAAGGLLAGLAEGPLPLTAGIALLGASAAIYHPVGLALLVAQSERTGRALGVNGVWGNLGVAAAPLGTAGLAALLDWQAAFLVPAAVSLACAFVGTDRAAAASVGGTAAEETPLPRGGDLVRVLAFLLASGLCGGLLFNVVTIALPKLLSDALGSGGVLGPGALATAIFTLAAFSQLLSGRWLDRTSVRRLALIFTLGETAVALLLGFSSGWLAVVAALLLTTAIFAEIPVSDTLVKRTTPPALRARAYGLLYLVSFAASAAAVPLIAGIYERVGSLQPLLWLLAAAAALLALSAATLPRGAGAPEASGDLAQEPRAAAG